MRNPPASLHPVLRRLAWRVAIGQFLEIWPRWAVAGLLIAGFIALVCRTFFASVADSLVLLWLAPVLAVVPAVVLCVRRAYRPSEIAALADSINGGHGTLLALLEADDRSSQAWRASAAFERLSTTLVLPRLRPWRTLWPLLPSAAFLLSALLLPQRILNSPGSVVIANDIATDLKNTVAELKKQDLITPLEEKKLEEEIDRIRKAAMQRVDSSSWEAADALREKVAADLSEKHDAMKWAEESIARYSASAQAGTPNSDAQAQELAKSIEKLAQMGMLADASGELQKLLGGQTAVAGGKVQLPMDAASLRKMNQLLSAHLAQRGQRFGELGKLGKEFGRFDPSEFPIFSSDPQPDGDGNPGAGGVNRGRGDAELTWGRESVPFDRFKAVALPPGSVRSPDDWAPMAVLPGAPKEAPEAGGRAAAQAYAGTAGQAAWRRTLSPRHYGAVKKYFDNTEPPR